jgi:hypothetical protein
MISFGMLMCGFLSVMRGAYARDALLHAMPKTKEEARVFLEHMSTLAGEAIDNELDYTVPHMFHSESAKGHNVSARDEMMEVIAMVMAHTEPIDEDASAPSSPASHAFGGRRRLKAEHRFTDVTAEEEEHYVYDHDENTNTVSIRRENSEEKARKDLRSLHHSKIVTTKPRIERHPTEEGTTTFHFPGPINKKHHPWRVLNAEQPSATETTARRRLSTTMVKCNSGDTASSCPTTVEIQNTAGTSKIEDPSSSGTSDTSMWGTYTVDESFFQCGGSKLYVRTGTGKKWYFYRYYYLGLYRRWILTDSEWDARGCAYVGYGTYSLTTPWVGTAWTGSTTGNILVFYDTSTSPADTSTFYSAAPGYGALSLYTSYNIISGIAGSGRTELGTTQVRESQLLPQLMLRSRLPAKPTSSWR